MHFKLEKKLHDESDEVIVDIASLETGNVAVSIYHALRNSKNDLVRSTMLKDQNFTPARCCAKSVEEKKRIVSQISRKDRAFRARLSLVERIVQLCDEVMDRFENEGDSEMKRK